MDLLLKELTWKQGADLIKGDLRVSRGVIQQIGTNLIPLKREQVLAFTNHYLYPGLINAHDHLEMNLYPRLGNPPYKNYIEWGNDIYKPRETPVKEIERVIAQDRLSWGGLKNLISGVTTVVHHNPWNRFLSSSDFPVRVLKKYTWAHSVGFGKNISKSFPKDSKTPFVIHAAEGIDEIAYAEIKTLNEKGLLKKNTVLIHAVASDKDIEIIRASKASVVWCPSSNYFLFNKTAPINELTKVAKVALGSDSTLTGTPTLLDEMHFAAQTGLTTNEDIYNQVTTNPASIFNLPQPAIEIGKPADLFVTAATHKDYYENLVNTQPASISIVLLKGEPRLCDESIATVLDLTNHFANIGGKQKWVFTDVQKLKKRIQVIAGKTVESNPLWKLIN